MSASVYVFADAGVWGSQEELRCHSSDAVTRDRRPACGSRLSPLTTGAPGPTGTQVIRFGGKHLCPPDHLADPDGGFSNGETFDQTGVLMKMWMPCLSPTPSREEPVQGHAQSVGEKRIQEWEGCAGLGAGQQLGRSIGRMLFSRDGGPPVCLPGTGSKRDHLA